MRLMRRDGGKAGQSMVEFALILPIFVLLVFGILDIGRAVYAYHTINNAATEGARVAIVNQTLATIQDRAASRAVGVGVLAADVTVDYRTSALPDTPDSCASRVGTATGPVTCTAIVQVPHDFTAVTPIVSNIIGTIQMAGESSMVVQFPCQDPGFPCPDPD